MPEITTGHRNQTTPLPPLDEAHRMGLLGGAAMVRMSITGGPRQPALIFKGEAICQEK